VSLRDHPFRWAAGGTLVLVALVLVAFTPRYERMDDPNMTLIAAGRVLTDRPDEHLLSTNVVIGLALKQLYTAAPLVPWYGLYQIGTLAAAGVALSYALLRVNPSPWQAAIALLVFALLTAPCLVGVGFRTTAFLASLAGLLLLLAPLRGAAPWPRAADAAGVALLVWGSLIHFESFLLALAAAVPTAVLAAISGGVVRSLWRTLPALVVAVMVAGLYLFNLGYYDRDPGWQDFYDYQAVRAKYERNSYNLKDGATERVDAMFGWSLPDLIMFADSFDSNRQWFSLPRLRPTVEAVAAAPRRASAYDPVFWWWGVTNEMGTIVFGTLTAQLLLAGMCLAVLSRGLWPFLQVGVSFGFALVVAALQNTAREPTHDSVAFLFLAGALAGAALCPGRGDAHRLKTLLMASRVASGVAVAALVLWSLLDLAEKQQQYRQQQQEAVQMLHELAPREDQLFVVWNDRFWLNRFVTPLGNLDALKDVRLLSLSPLLRTPISERRLQAFRIDDLYRAVCERPDVLLVTDPFLIQVALNGYMQYHYKIDPDLIEVKRFGEGRFPNIIYRPAHPLPAK
jgi:hypothetical protein